MTSIQVNGKQLYLKPSNSKFKKTAYILSQDIYKAFSRIGIEKEFITLELPRNPLKPNEPAEIQWIVNGVDHYYQCNTQLNYRDNLGCIAKVIEQDCYAIRNGMKTFGQVMKQFQLGFQEDREKIRSPLQILGLPENTTDKEYIAFKYKQKCKELHPDNTETGSEERFKELQSAYETLTKSGE